MNDTELTTLYERYNSGADIIVLSAQSGSSVSALFANWARLGLIKNEDFPEKVKWQEYYDAFKRDEINTNDVARELSCSVGTVYNKFRRLGLLHNKRDIIDLDALCKDYLDNYDAGLNNQNNLNMLSKKYNRTTIYLRTILNKFNLLKKSILNTNELIIDYFELRKTENNTDVLYKLSEKYERAPQYLRSILRKHNAFSV